MFGNEHIRRQFVKINELNEFQIWSKIKLSKNCSSFKSEPQSRFNSSRRSRTAKIIVWTDLNQVVVFQFHLGSSLSNDQFLDDLILTGTQ